MKKSTMRVLSLVMAIMMIVGTLAVVPFSATPEPAQHVHTKGEVVGEPIPATCTRYGYTVYACADCGKTYADDITEKIEHDYQPVGEVAATCAAPGSTAGMKCTMCGDILWGCEEIPSNHKIAYRIVDNADCLEGVFYEEFCDLCGKVLARQETIVDADDHDLDIDFDAGFVAPTCTEDGSAWVYCKNEGEYYFDNCSYRQLVTINKLGHIWQQDENGDDLWIVEKEATYTEAGLKYRVCERCGFKDYVEIPVLYCDHSWISNGYSFAINSNITFSSKHYQEIIAQLINDYIEKAAIADEAQADYDAAVEDLDAKEAALATAKEILGVPSIEDDPDTDEDETQIATGAYKTLEDAEKTLAEKEAALAAAEAALNQAIADSQTVFANENEYKDAKIAYQTAKEAYDAAKEAFEAAEEVLGVPSIKDDEETEDIDETRIATGAYKTLEDAQAIFDAAVEALGVPSIEDNEETEDIDETQIATGAYKTLEDAQAAYDEAKEVLGVPSIEDDLETTEVDETQEATGAWADFEDAAAALVEPQMNLETAQGAYNAALERKEAADKAYAEAYEKFITASNVLAGANNADPQGDHTLYEQAYAAADEEYTAALIEKQNADAGFELAESNLTDAKAAIVEPLANYVAAVKALAAAQTAFETAEEVLGVPSVEDDLETTEVDETQEATGAWKKLEDAIAALGTPSVEDDPETEEVDETEEATGAYAVLESAQKAFDEAFAAYEEAAAILGVPSIEDDPETTEVDETQEATGACKDLEDAEAALEEAMAKAIDGLAAAADAAAAESAAAAAEAQAAADEAAAAQAAVDDAIEAAIAAWNAYIAAKEAYEQAEKDVMIAAGVATEAAADAASAAMAVKSKDDETGEETIIATYTTEEDLDAANDAIAAAVDSTTDAAEEADVDAAIAAANAAKEAYETAKDIYDQVYGAIVESGNSDESAQEAAAAAKAAAEAAEKAAASAQAVIEKELAKKARKAALVEAIGASEYAKELLGVPRIEDDPETDEDESQEPTGLYLILEQKNAAAKAARAIADEKALEAAELTAKVAKATVHKENVIAKQAAYDAALAERDAAKDVRDDAEDALNDAIQAVTDAKAARDAAIPVKNAALEALNAAIEVRDIAYALIFSEAERYAKEFFDKYVKYCDVSDLYEVFACSKCNAEKVEVKFDKIGHQYGDFTFSFTGKVVVCDDIPAVELVDYTPATLTGGYTDLIYECEKPLKRERVCSICIARAEDLGAQLAPVTAENVGEVQKHDYTGWICQNAGCKNNTKFVVGNETYYQCTNCVHKHAENVCLNLDDTLRTITDYRISVVVDYSRVAIDPYDESRDIFVITDNRDENGEVPFDAYYLSGIGNGRRCFFDNVPALDIVGKVHGPYGELKEVAGTCVDESYTYQLCLTCGTKCNIVYGEKDPDNHDWSDWFVYVAATCTEKGTERMECLNGCGARKTRVIEIDPNNHPADALEYQTDEIGERIVLPATCVDPEQYVIVCKDCNKRVRYEDVPGSTPLPKDQIESHYVRREQTLNQKNINFVGKEEPTCTTAGNKSYEYCTLCDTIITIQGIDVFENEWTRFVNGELNPNLVIDALGHNFKYEAAVEPNCVTAGSNELKKCERCGYVEDGKDGAIIPALGHIWDYQGLEEGDKLSKNPLTIRVYRDDPKFGMMDDIFGYSARKDDDGNPCIYGGADDEGEYVEYVLDWVEPTCDKQGYIIGRFCTRDCCRQLTTIDYLDHDIVEYRYELPNEDEVHGGETYYAYTIYFCRDCKELWIEDYDSFTSEEHVPVTYTQTVGDEKQGDARRYKVVLTDDGIVEWNNVDYPDCIWDIYTANKCAYCGAFYNVDLESKVAAKGHYTASGDKIDLTCTAYDIKLAGIKCDACGLRMPYYVEEKVAANEALFTDQSVIRYYTANANRAELNEEDLADYGYFTIAHDWAYTLDCEQTIVKHCSICGIKVLNERYKENGYHEYILREGGIAPFALEDYDSYAFDYVVYPTATEEGHGTLTCVKCFKELEVVIPATGLVITGEYDGAVVAHVTDEDGNKIDESVIALTIGEEFTVTLYATAKEFKFSELKFYVAGGVELKDVELLYNFNFADDVAAKKSVDGTYFTIQVRGIKGFATIDAVDEPKELVRLTFTTRDLLLTDEYTRIDNIGINGVEATLNVEGTLAAVDASEVDSFGVAYVYNPAYTRSASDILTSIFGDDVNTQYDFDLDGDVDIDDYVMMNDFVHSNRTVSDFIALNPYYDFDEIVAGLDYRTFSTYLSCNPTFGTEEDIAYAIVLIQRAFDSIAYAEVVGNGYTIEEYAQLVIDLY